MIYYKCSCSFLFTRGGGPCFDIVIVDISNVGLSRMAILSSASFQFDFRSSILMVRIEKNALECLNDNTLRSIEVRFYSTFS